MATRGYQTYGRNTIVHQFVGQFAAGHAGIANREIETVGYRFVQVLIVNDIKLMAAEYFLQLVGTLSIDAYFLAEIVFTVGGSLQHGRHSILSAMAGSRRKCIEHSR